VKDSSTGIAAKCGRARLADAAAILTIAILVSACGGSAAAAPSSAAAPATAVVASPAAAVSPAATASPRPSAFARPTASPLASLAPEPALAALWTANGPPADRPWVSSPEVDPQGRIWAASPFDDAFWIIDRDGTYVESWAAKGSGNGDGELRLVGEGNGFGDVAFRSDGGFYVADFGNARIQQFTADREFVRAFGSFGTGPGQLTLPIDIDIDGAGNVYVFDDHRRDVQVFSPDGEYLRQAATHVGPYIAVDEHGNVYTVDNDSRVLYRYTPAGEVDLAIDLTPLVHFATGLDISPSGDLFMTTSNNGGDKPVYEVLLELAVDGTLKHVWPNGAEAIAIDPQGDRVYLTGSDASPDVRAFKLPAD